MTLLATGGAVRRLDMTAAATTTTSSVRSLDVCAASTSAAAVRCFECASLLGVLMLEGLHRLRVLALQILLTREVLLLNALLVCRLLASERLRFLLLSAHQVG